MIRAANSWSEIAPRLGRALGSERDAMLLRHEVESGRCQGWIADRAAMLTRVEGRELVLVAVQGRDLGPLLRHVIERARKAGLESMRGHTKRPGLLRLVQRIEPTIHCREIVLGMEL